VSLPGPTIRVPAQFEMDLLNSRCEFLEDLLRRYVQALWPAGYEVPQGTFTTHEIAEIYKIVSKQSTTPPAEKKEEA
jgi:hypothetical protein